MQKGRKIVSILLLALMIFSMAPTTVFAAEKAALEGTGVLVKLDKGKGGTYKLVFCVKTNTKILAMDVTFSYDNTVVEPVRYSDQTIIRNITDESKTLEPFNVLVRNQLEKVYDSVSLGWRIGENRTAVNYAIFPHYDWDPDKIDDPTNNYDPMYIENAAISANSLINLFEFNFRLKDGKTLSDMNKATFRFEDSIDQDCFIPRFITTKDGAGITLMESQTASYFWGAENPDDKQNLDSDAVIFDHQGTPTVLLGDVDGNEIINFEDVLDTLNHYLGITPLVGDAFIAGDVNKDGIVNFEDVLNILNHYLGVRLL